MPRINETENDVLLQSNLNARGTFKDQVATVLLLNWVCYSGHVKESMCDNWVVNTCVK